MGIPTNVYHATTCNIEDSGLLHMITLLGTHQRPRLRAHSINLQNERELTHLGWELHPRVTTHEAG